MVALWYKKAVTRFEFESVTALREIAILSKRSLQLFGRGLQPFSAILGIKGLQRGLKTPL